jgi:hypothetical protein
VGVKAARLWLIKMSRWVERRSEWVRVKVQGVKVEKVKEMQLLATTPLKLFLFIFVIIF